MKNVDKKGLKARKLTICSNYVSRENGSSTKVPVVTLKGKWFEASGFKAGHIIDVNCVEEGKLIITLAKEQRYKVK